MFRTDISFQPLPPPSLLPPPPPPAPPPMQQIIRMPVHTENGTPAVVQGAPSEVVKPFDGRASLLVSIRQVGRIGKANMHSVKEMKLEKKKIKEQEQVIATEGGGALTSDLFNKLGLRRKYISEKGPADRNADSPAGAFAQISDTIRPMPPPQVMSGDGNVDEWES
ncbi:hypothetical protein AB205_0050040 [Aquarana catesbeiana]|uniref:WH2 domain-containing protein n=1 Tax=Aquarana catesbeiana TaxID=8400 RepID=A0A2G9RC95_AQUCT|nr:hypothetical protein AB205_0050040 [Aquarana catesbeiana]